jgi:hypothetical protein
MYYLSSKNRTQWVAGEKEVKRICIIGMLIGRYFLFAIYYAIITVIYLESMLYEKTQNKKET